MAQAERTVGSSRTAAVYPGKVSRADCFRIGTIGRIFPDDVRDLLRAVEQTLAVMFSTGRGTPGGIRIFSGFSRESGPRPDPGSAAPIGKQRAAAGESVRGLRRASRRGRARGARRGAGVTPLT